MQRSSVRLYLPFLAVVAIQALLITLAPSTPPGRVDTAGAGAPRTGTVAGPTVTDPATGQTVPGVAGVDPVTGQPLAGGPGAPIDPATGQPQPGGPQAATGDTSHCVGDRQFQILLHDPPCVPRFTGDNGGATYQGVTADSVRIVVFEAEPNQAVNAVLAPQGLAATDAELAAIDAAAVEFIEANYELYGRSIELIRFRGACPTSPPVVEACLEDAREVVRMQPFMVVWATPLYDRVFDEWARAGIISVGGWHFSEPYFTAEGRRGLRYDVFMDGSRSVQLLAEYYCQKMAGGNASHAGATIHPSIGGRDTRRRLGISVPEIEANVRDAQLLAQLVQQCDPGAAAPVIRTYVSDIQRAAEQTTSTTLAYINAKVTTVVCLCDPIAPAFQTKGFTQQGYFPEYLLSGTGLLDYDLLGRLYDPQQMQHAFGLGHLAEPVPFEQSDAARMWRATGRPGLPCKSCNLPWGYMSFVASTLHGTGPILNPQTVEAAVLNSERYGGDVIGTQYVEFGPGDYTAISDAREIYWCATCTSRIDGRAGAYVSPNNSARYRQGQIRPGLEQIPVAPS